MECGCEPNTIVRHAYPGSRFRYVMTGWRSAGKRASSVAGAASDGATQQAALKPLPFPEASRWRDSIPPDNPQTTEKIGLGQRLFFDGRLSVEGDGCILN